jgi:tRNA-2-methylthio-N6-dimethylallyladenosine synthase
MEDVLAEVESLARRGVLEIEFLGQTVNAYRDARGRTLADLLRASSRVRGLRRIRFTTSHPARMTESLMDSMAEAGSLVCPYLHLPVQSGSSAVLAAMRRGHDRDAYLRTIESLRRRMPGLALGTDLIVGFPSEGESEFEQTMSLLDEVGFDTVYAFAYSPRPGTAALDLGDPVPRARKRERLARLLDRQQALQERRNRDWIGRDVDVLVEGPSKRDRDVWTGRTPENRIVHFRGRTAPGRLERVRVREATAYWLGGEPAAVLPGNAARTYT